MDPAKILIYAQVAFGIGLVIFVHELGHFIAARLCGVRVECFSLGLGPRLLGWRVGDTMYQIAAIPFGGYCRMAGEERRWDGAPPADDKPEAFLGQSLLDRAGLMHRPKKAGPSERYDVLNNEAGQIALAQRTAA